MNLHALRKIYHVLRFYVWFTISSGCVFFVLTRKYHGLRVIYQIFRVILLCSKYDLQWFKGDLPYLKGDLPCWPFKILWTCDFKVAIAMSNCHRVLSILGTIWVDYNNSLTTNLNQGHLGMISLIHYDSQWGRSGSLCFIQMILEIRATCACRWGVRFVVRGVL